MTDRDSREWLLQFWHGKKLLQMELRQPLSSFAMRRSSFQPIKAIISLKDSKSRKSAKVTLTNCEWKSNLTFFLTEINTTWIELSENCFGKTGNRAGQSIRIETENIAAKTKSFRLKVNCVIRPHLFGPLLSVKQNKGRPFILCLKATKRGRFHRQIEMNRKYIWIIFLVFHEKKLPMSSNKRVPVHPKVI